MLQRVGYRRPGGWTIGRGIQRIFALPGGSVWLAETNIYRNSLPGYVRLETVENQVAVLVLIEAEVEKSAHEAACLRLPFADGCLDYTCEWIGFAVVIILKTLVYQEIFALGKTAATPAVRAVLRPAAPRFGLRV